MIRRTAHTTPPCNPRGLDLRPPRQEIVYLDGAAKQSLETGRTRLLVAGLVFALAFLFIAARLFDLSLLAGGSEPRLATKPPAERLATGRADIVDRNGVVLASTLPTASLFANPRQVRDPATAAGRLAAALPELARAEVFAKLSTDRAFVWLKRNLTPRQQAAVNRLGIPGIYFQREATRVYPNGSLVSHVVGFTDVDNRGLAGIERAFDEVLRGGTRPLELSLDLRIQHILAQELGSAMTEFKAIGAAGVVLDIETGEVVAMVSLPSFDPDSPGQAPAEARFNRASLGVYEMGSVFKIFTTAMALDQGAVRLMDSFNVSSPIRVARFTIRDFKPKKAWLTVPEAGEVVAMVSLPSFDPESPGQAPAEARFNRASLGVYEMGSVFKIFTTAMALDQGAVRLMDSFNVSSPIRVARFTIRDFKPKKAWLTVPEIFIYSSNIGTVQMAMEAGTQRQQAFLKNLGLTRRASIELPEVGAPMVPSPWREINTMTIAYGHGLAVNALQLANAAAAIVGGGELKPTTLIKRSERERVVGQRVISEKTSDIMRWLMRMVVLKGTGRKSNAPGYYVGGKTGTADKLQGGRYAKNARIASFLAAFPMNAPRYVVFALIDEPKGNKKTFGYATGGWVAAPVVRRVVERMAPLVGIDPRPEEEVIRVDALMTPSIARGFSVAAK